MNPLIKELASKALKQPDTDNDGLTVFDNDELEKFAELIIEEACRALDAYDDFLKKHFGVEE